MVSPRTSGRPTTRGIPLPIRLKPSQKTEHGRNLSKDFSYRQLSHGICSPANSPGKSKVVDRQNYRLSPNTANAGKQNTERVRKIFPKTVSTTSVVQCVDASVQCRLLSPPNPVANAAVQCEMNSWVSKMLPARRGTFVVSPPRIVQDKGADMLNLTFVVDSDYTGQPAPKEQDSVTSGVAEVSKLDLQPVSYTNKHNDNKTIIDILKFHLSKYSCEENCQEAKLGVQNAWLKLCNKKKMDIGALKEAVGAVSRCSDALLKVVINTVDVTYGSTALHLAAYRGCPEVISLLLDTAVANPNILNRAGYSCLMVASYRPWPSDDWGPFQRLARDSDINLRSNPDQSTALITAAENDQLLQASELLSCGADINAQDAEGYTALMVAAALGHENLCSLLTKRLDCNTKLCCNLGQSAAQIASSNGFGGIAAQIVSQEISCRSRITDRRATGRRATDLPATDLPATGPLPIGRRTFIRRSEKAAKLHQRP